MLVSTRGRRSATSAPPEQVRVDGHLQLDRAPGQALRAPAELARSARLDVGVPPGPGPPASRVPRRRVDQPVERGRPCRGPVPRDASLASREVDGAGLVVEQIGDDHLGAADGAGRGRRGRCAAAGIDSTMRAKRNSSSSISSSSGDGERLEHGRRRSRPPGDGRRSGRAAGRPRRRPRPGCGPESEGQLGDVMEPRRCISGADSVPPRARRGAWRHGVTRAPKRSVDARHAGRPGGCRVGQGGAEQRGSGDQPRRPDRVRRPPAPPVSRSARADSRTAVA